MVDFERKWSVDGGCYRSVFFFPKIVGGLALSMCFITGAIF
jgi:hypothetical protein